MPVTVKIKKLNENAKLPSYGSEFAAGADLCACTDTPVEIPAHATVLIRTGLAAASYCGQSLSAVHPLLSRETLLHHLQTHII